MMDESLHEIRQSKSERLEVLFFCLLAVWCFGLGLYYWIRLTGVFPAEDWRFDLMDWPWRCLSAAMAVLYPVAACGLWLQSRWGIVLWLAAGVAETVCYLFLSPWFGYNVWLPLLHIIFVLLYAAVIFYRYRLARDDLSVITEY